MKTYAFASLATLALVLAPSLALAQEAEPDMSHAKKVEQYARTFLKSWGNDPKLHEAIKASTAKSKGLGYDDVQIQDKEWQLARTKGKTDEKTAAAATKLTEDLAGLDKKSAAEHMAAGEKTISEIRGSATSKFLQAQLEKAPKGAVTEIFVMDGWGWNVGQTGGTSDFYQGDEGKWQKTFAGGADGVEVLPIVEEDGVKISQVSLPITEGDTNIGAVTIGVDVSKVD
ncbi:hypothetical protein [Terrihabitans sp. B22-R8]|uniref:hypothetical protein n=1 Tax=Terrihabitans sp. B22-R8 TaxID=3425128 RepID=UPI00403D14B8